MALAGATAEFGRKEKAAEALITAGSLLLQVQALSGGKFGTIKEKPLGAKDEELDVAAEEEKSFKDQAEDLFDEALAVDGKTRDLIKAAKARKYAAPDTTSRDVVGGPRRITRKIDAGGLQVYKFQFRHGRPAGVCVHSTVPMRFVVYQDGWGTLLDVAGTNGFYNWTPGGKGKKGTVHVHVQIRG